MIVRPWHKDYRMVMFCKWYNGQLTEHQREYFKKWEEMSPVRRIWEWLRGRASS